MPVSFCRKRSSGLRAKRAVIPMESHLELWPLSRSSESVVGREGNDVRLFVFRPRLGDLPEGLVEIEVEFLPFEVRHLLAALAGRG